jgi:hypothetical protein
MSQQITWNFRVIQENPFLLFQFLANFSFGAKFDNEVQQTLCQNLNHMSRLFAKGPKTVLELTCFSLTATYKMLGN